MTDNKVDRDGIEPETGREVADDQLEGVAGGTTGHESWYILDSACPQCGKHTVFRECYMFFCDSCGWGGSDLS